MQLFFANALIALKQVAMLYAIAGIGLAAERLRWFPEATARLCTKLLLYVVTPCVVVNAFVSIEYSAQAVRGLGISFACGALLHGAGILISEPFFRGRKDAAAESVLHFAAIYGNCGYMGLPLAQAMVGPQGVFYVSVVILTFQICSFTHGTFVMSGGVMFRKQGPAVTFQWKNLLLNAGVLSVAVGLPIFLLRAPVPALIKTPLASVASMNSPLAMLMFGAYLSRTRLKGLLRSRKLFLAMGIKLLALPAVVLGALLLLRAEPALLNAMLIPAAAPSANNTVVFAARHGRDTGYAAQVVSLLSLASVVTMPMMIALGLSL
ncbi:MAG: AEC family transporter [Oscillospiraceae bacterium]|jgi:predicted permease|nr:AEC family transporter [Oscillospiraceae bacterium]